MGWRADEASSRDLKSDVEQWGRVMCLVSGGQSREVVCTLIRGE